MAREKKVDVSINLKDKASASLKKVKKSFLSLKNVIIGSAIFAGVAKGIASITRAAIRQEDAVNGLTQALKNNNDFTQSNIAALQAQASALQTVTKFGDEQILELQQELATYGMSTDAIKTNTKLTLDLAAAKKINLVTASQLIGKAFKGETGSLSRYGLIIDANIPKSEKFAAVQTLIARQFGGAAQAQIRTFGGAITQLGNAYGDVKESLGTFITQNETLREVLASVLGGLQKITNWAKTSNKARREEIELISEVLRINKDLAAVIRDAGKDTLLLDRIKQLAELKRQYKILEATQKDGIATNSVLIDHLERQTEVMQEINRLRKDPGIKEAEEGLKREARLTSEGIRAEKEKSKVKKATVESAVAGLAKLLEAEKKNNDTIKSGAEQFSADLVEIAKATLEEKKVLFDEEQAAAQSNLDKRATLVKQFNDEQLRATQELVNAELSARDRLVNRLVNDQLNQERAALRDSNLNWTERKILIEEQGEKADLLFKKMASGEKLSAVELEKLVAEFDRLSETIKGVADTEQVAETLKEIGTLFAQKISDIRAKKVSIDLDVEAMVLSAQTAGEKMGVAIKRSVEIYLRNNPIQVPVQTIKPSFTK